MIYLTRPQLAEIVRHLAGAYPAEGCGLLLGRREAGEDRVEEVRPLANASGEGRSGFYEMDAADLLAAEKAAGTRGLAVLGAFHSHPDGTGRPSAVDLERAWDGYSYLIAAIRGGEAAEWNCWIFREKGKTFEPRVVRLSG